MPKIVRRKLPEYRKDHDIVIAWLDVYDLGMINKTKCIEELRVLGTGINSDEEAEQIILHYLAQQRSCSM